MFSPLEFTVTLTDKTKTYTLKALVATYYATLAGASPDMLPPWKAKHVKIQFDPLNITSKYYLGGVSVGRQYLGGQEAEYGPFATSQITLEQIVLNCNEDAKTVNIMIVP